MSDETIFEGSCKWPATTIGGELGFRSGSVSFSRYPDGSILISGCDGPEESDRIEDSQFWEYVLPPEQAEELLAGLLRSRPTT